MRVSVDCLGYRPDLPDDRDFVASSLVLPSVQSVPATHDDRHLVAEIWNQGSLGSCPAQAISGAIRAREWYEEGGPQFGPAPEATSRFFIWWHARNQHGDAKRNTGTYLRTCFAVLGELGRPGEGIWPYVTSDLKTDAPFFTRKPAPNTLSHGHDRRAALYHRVTEEGDVRVPVLKQLSADHRFPAFGTDVAYSFLEDDGPTYNVKPPYGESIAGGHAMYIVGYDEHGAWVVNSWTKRWRLGGLVHLSWEYLAWSRTRDIWAVSLS